MTYLKKRGRPFKNRPPEPLAMICFKADDEILQALAEIEVAFFRGIMSNGRSAAIRRAILETAARLRTK